MLDYDQEKKLYLVKRVFVPNKILEKKNGTMAGGSGGESDGPSDNSDSDGSQTSLSNKTPLKNKLVESSDNIHYWVPRVRLMFVAENPLVFVERVANAYYLREKTEALLRYNDIDTALVIHYY